MYVRDGVTYKSPSYYDGLNVLNKVINGVDVSDSPSDLKGVYRTNAFGVPVPVYPESVSGRGYATPVKSTPSASSSSVFSRSSTAAPTISPAVNSNYSASVGVVDDVVNKTAADTGTITTDNSTSAGDPNNSIKNEEREYYFRAFTDYLDAMQQSWKAANEEQRANWERAARWNEQMYDTRYQRTVADLKKAGLNPLLIGGALSSQGSVSMSAAAGFSPSMPSTPYSSTSSSEISGLFNLYNTLINMTSNERIAYLQNVTKNREIDMSFVNTFVSTLGRMLGGLPMAISMA